MAQRRGVDAAIEPQVKRTRSGGVCSFQGRSSVVGFALLIPSTDSPHSVSSALAIV